MSDTPRTNSPVTMIVAVLLLSLMGAGAGFSVGMIVQPGKEPAAAAVKPATTGAETPATSNAATTAGEKDGTAEDAPSEDAAADLHLSVIPIPPVLTTLAAPQGKWIRLEGSILAKPEASGPPDVLAEQAGEQILAYLRTVRLEQLQGPSGFLALRDDLNETVRSMSKGDVEAVLIHGLLVE